MTSDVQAVTVRLCPEHVAAIQAARLLVAQREALGEDHGLLEDDLAEIVAMARAERRLATVRPVGSER